MPVHHPQYHHSRLSPLLNSFTLSSRLRLALLQIVPTTDLSPTRRADFADLVTNGVLYLSFIDLKTTFKKNFLKHKNVTLH